MCMLEDALEQLQISPLSCELIRTKDGIAAEAFCEVYDTSEVESEKIADDILSHLVTLCIACEREKFPIWAEKSKELLLSGELQQRFMKW